MTHSLSLREKNCVIMFACVSVCVEAFANARVCSWQIFFFISVPCFINLSSQRHNNGGYIRLTALEVALG